MRPATRTRYERSEDPRPLSINRGVAYTDPFGLCVPPITPLCLIPYGIAIGGTVFGATRIVYNAATDRPLGEGVQSDAAQGALFGGSMGASAAAAGGIGLAYGRAAVNNAPKIVATSDLAASHSVTKASVRKLAAQIKADGGIREPLKYVIHQGQKVVVDGNHRLAAARLLAMRTVPAQRVDLPYAGFKTAADLIFNAGRH